MPGMRAPESEQKLLHRILNERGHLIGVPQPYITYAGEGRRLFVPSYLGMSQEEIDSLTMEFVERLPSV